MFARESQSALLHISEIEPIISLNISASTMSTKHSSAPTTPNLPTLHHHERNESLLSRTILAPVLFLSFIISLLIVDRRTSSSILSPRSSPRGSPPGSPQAEEKNEHSYYHSHQRKLAKNAMDEAFAIRGKVIVGMCVLAGIGFVGTVALGVKVWSLVSHVQGSG